MECTRPGGQEAEGRNPEGASLRAGRGGSFSSESHHQSMLEDTAEAFPSKTINRCSPLELPSHLCSWLKVDI